MLRKLMWVGIGVAAFVVASAGVSLVSMGVSALVPGASPDKEGKIDPSPEEKAKAEWLTQMGGSSETQSSTQSKETTETSKETETKAAEPQPEAQPQESERSAPPPVVAPTPPRVSTGPGNFDAPMYSPPPPVPQVGPGNL